MPKRSWLPLSDLLTLGVAALVAALTPACGSEPEFPEQPMPAPTPMASNPAPAPTPMASTAPPPPVTAGACDAVQTTAFTTMLMGRATTEAPRMEQVGSLVCGVAPEGQPVNGTTLMLEQGYCYTVLGQSLPSVNELDVQIVVDLAGGGIPPALAAMAQAPLAVDNTAGQSASIGAGNNCYQWPLPIPAAVKLVLKPRSGSGPVAAQVYRRKK